MAADDFEDGELARTVGKAIANRRKRMELTQEQLSEAAGIAQASLSHIERGQVLPSLDRLAQLAALLHCRLADLLAEAGTTPGDRATRIHEKLSALAPAQQEALERLLDEAIKLATNSRTEPRRKAR